MSNDWMDIEETLEGSETPGFPLTPRAIDSALDSAERRAQFIVAWNGLTETQRIFLNTWRANRFSARKAVDILRGTSFHVSRGTITNWNALPDYDMVRRALRAASVEEILSKDHLIARHDDIIESSLSVGEFGTAARANEALMKVGGLLKDKEIDVNVGIVGPSLTIQVVQADGGVQEISAVGVPIELPPPAIDAEWAEVDDGA